MGPFTLINVTARTPGDGGTGIENLQAEIERYMYGRYMVLAAEVDGRLITFTILVEEHYVGSVVPRLGSGLFGARRLTAEEVSAHVS